MKVEELAVRVARETLEAVERKLKIKVAVEHKREVSKKISDNLQEIMDKMVEGSKG